MKHMSFRLREPVEDNSDGVLFLLESNGLGGGGRIEVDLLACSVGCGMFDSVCCKKVVNGK
jgi:hypothetical protein